MTIRPITVFLFPQCNFYGIFNEPHTVALNFGFLYWLRLAFQPIFHFLKSSKLISLRYPFLITSFTFLSIYYKIQNLTIKKYFINSYF
jgi:hypothetical protein